MCFVNTEIDWKYVYVEKLMNMDYGVIFVVCVYRCIVRKRSNVNTCIVLYMMFNNG